MIRRGDSRGIAEARSADRPTAPEVLFCAYGLGLTVIAYTFAKTYDWVRWQVDGRTL